MEDSYFFKFRFHIKKKKTYDHKDKKLQQQQIEKQTEKIKLKDLLRIQQLQQAQSQFDKINCLYTSIFKMISVKKREDTYLQSNIQSENDISSSTNQFIEKLLVDKEVSQSLAKHSISQVNQQQQGQKILQESQSFEQQRQIEDNQSNSESPIRNNLSNEDYYTRQNACSVSNEQMQQEEFLNLKSKQEKSSFSEKLELCKESYALRNSSPFSYSDQMHYSRKSTALSLYSNQSDSSKAVNNSSNTQENEKSSSNSQQDDSLNKLKKNLFANSTNCQKQNSEIGNDNERVQSPQQKNSFDDYVQTSPSNSSSIKNSKEKIILIQKPSSFLSSKENTNQKSNTSNIFQINQSTSGVSQTNSKDESENSNENEMNCCYQLNSTARGEQLFQNFQKNFNSTLANKNSNQQIQYEEDQSFDKPKDIQEQTINNQDSNKQSLEYDSDRVYMAFTLLMHSKSFASQIQQQNPLQNEQGINFTTEKIIEELNQLDFSKLEDGSLKQDIFNELCKKQSKQSSENEISHEQTEDRQDEEYTSFDQEEQQDSLDQDIAGGEQILSFEKNNEKEVDNQKLNLVLSLNSNDFSSMKANIEFQEKSPEKEDNLNQKLFYSNNKKYQQAQECKDAQDKLKISLENLIQSCQDKQKEDLKQKINSEQSNKKGFQLSASHLNSKRGIQIRETISLNKSLLIQLKQSDSLINNNNQIASDKKQSKFSSTQILQNQNQNAVTLKDSQDTLPQQNKFQDAFIYSTPDKSKKQLFQQTKNNIKKRKISDICKYKKISPNNNCAVEVLTNQSNPWAYKDQTALQVKYKAISSNHKQQIQVIDLRALRLEEEEKYDESEEEIEELNKQIKVNNQIQWNEHIISEIEIQNSSIIKDKAVSKIPIQCLRKVDSKQEEQVKAQQEQKSNSKQYECLIDNANSLSNPNIQCDKQRQFIIKFGDQIIINNIQNTQTDLIQKKKKFFKQINKSQQQLNMQEQDSQLKNIICLSQILGLSSSVEAQQKNQSDEQILEESPLGSPQSIISDIKNKENNQIQTNEDNIMQSIQLINQIASFNHNVIASLQPEKSSQQSSVISKLDQENAQNELDEVLSNLKVNNQCLQQNKQSLEEYLNQLISEQSFDQGKIINNNNNNNNSNTNNLKDKKQIIINSSQINNKKEKQNSPSIQQNSIAKEFKSKEKFDKLNLRHRSKRIMERKQKQSLQQQLLEDRQQLPSSSRDCDQIFENQLQNEECSQQEGHAEDKQHSSELSEQSYSQQQMQNNLINTKIKNKIEKNQKKVKNSKIIYGGPAPSPKTTHLAEIIMPEKYEQYLAQVGGISRSGTMCSQTTQPLYPAVLSKQNSNQSSFSVNEEDLQQKQFDQQQLQQQQQYQIQSKAQKKAALKKKNKLTQNIEQVFYDDDDESAIQTKQKRKSSKNTDENHDDQIDDESSAGSAEQFAKCSDGSQSKSKFDTKNLVKNFLNQFLTFVQSEEEEQQIMELLGINDASELNEYKNILKQFFKNKKFNRALLKEFVFIVGYRKLFLHFLQNKAHNWIMQGRMKDKASHLRALQNFIYICQNFTEIKSWRFRYNFV
ncbi:hypothetical protein TTHERM_01213950 (macronuclear) [Tetrahymena thermophila SB210]|uniref:Uncharacterized protein n=1 Tax=Tetrahymena thermophila (strain SB210) TaxID=312017 RepID=Q24G70_TETTS|nr:hypothetical protein TTHERM_01213950 [Tetrahymena thermophila SB210]EAS06783.2 hypothetical protein TTHERM_01213950 [Tetrahymena thermophila SB210]|eukprot:XP_001027025.2 hypothetical protein TTHERM_01213950 [Tetrahymena thermophila SB210]